MQTAVFYGSSDDLVEIEGVKGGDERPFREQRYVLGGKLVVRPFYDGCWSFAVGQIDEDIPLPDWPIRIMQHDNGYSVRLEIDVPDDVAVIEAA